jgi:predicted amidophosphoribosyltransferase
MSPANQWITNYKKGVEHRGEKQWYYKQEAIKKFADLIIDTPIDNHRIVLLAGPPSKCRSSPFFDARNEEVLKIVQRATGVPISFNLEAVRDIEPTHFQGGHRSPEKLNGLYTFVPFKEIPDIVYIVDDVITSGSHYVVWRDLVHKFHPDTEVRGIYLARTVNQTVL